jgi:hypothetical protein
MPSRPVRVIEMAPSPSAARKEQESDRRRFPRIRGDPGSASAAI